jgi:hypothetical protein
MRHHVTNVLPFAAFTKDSTPLLDEEFDIADSISALSADTHHDTTPPISEGWDDELKLIEKLA